MKSVVHTKKEWSPRPWQIRGSSKTKIKGEGARKSTRRRKSNDTRHSQKSSKLGSFSQGVTHTASTFAESARVQVHTATSKIKDAAATVANALKVLWGKFITGFKKALSASGPQMMRTLQRCAELLCRGLVKLLRVVFLPLLTMMRLVYKTTEAITYTLLTQWKRVFSLLFFMVAIVVCMDEQKLVDALLPREVTTPSKEETDATATATSNGSRIHDTYGRKVTAVKKVFQKCLYIPLSTFLAVGLPQLTYELLRVWHLILVDGVVLLRDLMVSGLDSAKTLMPESISKCMRWDLLESESMGARLAGIRKNQVVNGRDPLLRSYLAAKSTLAKTHRSWFVRKGKSSEAESREKVAASSVSEHKNWWNTAMQSAKQGVHGAHNRYVRADFG